MTPIEQKNRLSELLPLVYDQMRAYASRVLESENEQVALQTTDLVHEVYLRLAELREICWKDEHEMMRTAVAIMRRVLVDQSRSRNATKRRAPGRPVQIDSLDEFIVQEPRSIDLVHLDDALVRLAEVDPRKSQIVSLRYFGGLSMEEVAVNLDISLATIKRDWAVAKAWLVRELTDESPAD